LREEPLKVHFHSQNLDYYKKDLEEEISVPSMENMSQLFYQSIGKFSGSESGSFKGFILGKKIDGFEASDLSKNGSSGRNGSGGVDDFIPNNLKMSDDGRC